MTIETVQKTDHENDATHEERVTTRHPPEPAFGRDNSEQSSMYERMRQKLAPMGINIDQLDYRTGPGEEPPCFEMNQTAYAAWLRDQANELPPIRYDMPAEPNYCNDCQPEFKVRAMTAGACMFPNTRFETRMTDGEKEMIGVSRSAEIPPEGSVIYQEITVPLSALHVRLKDYVRNHRLRMLPRERMPEHLKKVFATQSRPKGRGSRE